MTKTNPMYVKPVIPDWVPDKLSGRSITNRGVHMLPFGFHNVWMRKERGDIAKPCRGEWLEELQGMFMSWVILINTGDSVIKKIDGVSPVEALLNIGIIPIIRGLVYFPGGFNDLDTVKETVKIYNKYNLRPLWIIGNEPLDIREWKLGYSIPPYDEAMKIVTDRWVSAARDIINAGGVVGFPDGPDYAKNPFELIQPFAQAFHDGTAFYAGHHYGKNRSIDFPYDSITQTGLTELGEPFTEKEYREALDDFADDRQWYEESVDQINDARKKLADDSLSAWGDNAIGACYRSWEQIVYWSKQTFGFVVPMALTEGGWTPRDRAGSTNLDIDIRLPHTTPRMVGKKTLQMYSGNSPFFAICPWLIADDAMQIHGYVGWPYDSWYGWAYSERYGYRKPVAEMLMNERPIPLRDWAGLQCKNIMFP